MRFAQLYPLVCRNLTYLTNRVVAATKWLHEQPETKDLSIGYFGASTGGGAAIVAAAMIQDDPLIKAVVSRGGRPDLAGTTST